MTRHKDDRWQIFEEGSGYRSQVFHTLPLNQFGQNVQQNKSWKSHFQVNKTQFYAFRPWLCLDLWFKIINAYNDSRALPQKAALILQGENYRAEFKGNYLLNLRTFWRWKVGQSGGPGMRHCNKNRVLWRKRGLKCTVVFTIGLFIVNTGNWIAYVKTWIICMVQMFRQNDG
jgi:hypothetical protein